MRPHVKQHGVCLGASSEFVWIVLLQPVLNIGPSLLNLEPDQDFSQAFSSLLIWDFGSGLSLVSAVFPN